MQASKYSEQVMADYYAPALNPLAAYTAEGEQQLVEWYSSRETRHSRGKEPVIAQTYASTDMVDFYQR